MRITFKTKQKNGKMQQLMSCLVVFSVIVLFLSVIALSAQNSSSNQNSPSSITLQSLSPENAESPDNQDGNTDIEKVAQVLFVFLVLSVVFEAAMTPVFNWRFFLAHFDKKGWKTPLTLILAIVVFRSYGLDIIERLLVALGYSASVTWGGQILTAFLIAGGSDGIFRIYKKLGIRDFEDREIRSQEAKDALEKKTRQKAVK